jgi:hypothetical protein
MRWLVVTRLQPQRFPREEGLELATVSDVILVARSEQAVKCAEGNRGSFWKKGGPVRGGSNRPGGVRWDRTPRQQAEGALFLCFDYLSGGGIEEDLARSFPIEVERVQQGSVRSRLLGLGHFALGSLDAFWPATTRARGSRDSLSGETRTA